MTEFRPPSVEPLSNHHDRETFSCGVSALDAYFRKQAGQDARRNVARVFVALDALREAVVGFYTLSAASYRREDLPAELARKLPFYPVPAALIGRLAVDTRFQGRSYGKFLLMDALRRVMVIEKNLAVQAVIVEAKDSRAESFYRSYGFQPFIDRSQRLFLPLANVEIPE